VSALPTRTLVAYAAPAIGFGFASMLVGSYLMKHATDVLAIPPATMGAILLASRLWDAGADPLAGFLSDRTRTRLGRRRPWMLAGAIPLALAFVALWCPPLGLSPAALAAWVCGAALLLFTAQTAVRMPHEALGAELSRDYHERTRIFGARRAAFGVGALCVFAALMALGRASDPRAATFALVAPMSALGALLVFASCAVLREPEAHAGRGAAHPFAALRDLLANPHARRLLSVTLLQQIAMGGITTAAAYHAEYVLGDPDAFPKLLGCFFSATLVSIPFWVRLGRRFEKKALLIASMAGMATSLGAMIAVGAGDFALFYSLAAIGGFAAGGLDVLLPSLQADVIDWDELRTGERKEGVYFAAWHLAEKLALGIAAATTGIALSASGFVPNQPQGESALLAMRLLLSLFPLACYGSGVLIFLGFGLDRAAHASVQRSLLERGLAVAR
jgi:GPH family glycoside/pentoside/hexuronide:cation symporter